MMIYVSMTEENWSGSYMMKEEHLDAIPESTCNLVKIPASILEVPVRMGVEARYGIENEDY